MLVLAPVLSNAGYPNHQNEEQCRKILLHDLLFGISNLDARPERGEGQETIIGLLFSAPYFHAFIWLKIEDG